MVSGRDRCRFNLLVELPDSSPVDCVVRWDPADSLWNGVMLTVSLLLAPMLFSWGALAICLVLSGTTLLLGHREGFHRRLIHLSFDGLLWLEPALSDQCTDLLESRARLAISVIRAILAPLSALRICLVFCGGRLRLPAKTAGKRGRNAS